VDDIRIHFQKLSWRLLDTKDPAAQRGVLEIGKIEEAISPGSAGESFGFVCNALTYFESS
jgi:hypothetical protein